MAPNLLNEKTFRRPLEIVVHGPKNDWSPNVVGYREPRRHQVDERGRLENKLHGGAFTLNLLM